MFARISEYITQQLETNNVIIKENRELYKFGIQNGLIITLNLITSLIIGAFLGEFVYSILLLVVYIPLRTYSGGYHASTPIRCYVVSSGIMVLWLSVLKWIEIPSSCCVISFFLCFIICIYLSPIDTKNKKFDKNEKKEFGKRAKIVIIIYAAIWLSALCADIQIVVKIITLAVCTETIMMIIGIIDNNRYKKRK